MRACVCVCNGIWMFKWLDKTSVCDLCTYLTFAQSCAIKMFFARDATTQGLLVH